jgi:diacylglycerol O-acyltransferase / wax synthase
MLSLTDSDRSAEVEPDDDARLEHRPRGLLSTVAGTGSRVLTLAGHVASVAFAQAGETARAPGHARRLVGAVGRDGATAVRLLLTPADAATPIKGDPGISRRVSWSEPLSLPRIKRVAHSHNATVNDVLLAAVSGALRHYLQDRDSAVYEIQAMVPFNLRALDQPVPRDLGNKFGLVFLPLPVGVSGSYRRLVEVHHRMSKLKRSRDASVSYALLSASGLAPEPFERRIVDIFSGKGTAVMTNVPGPHEPVYLAGTPVRTVLFWAPTSGHIGMSVSIFSYRDEVTVGLMVDAALTPNPGKIISQLERELDALDAARPRAQRRRRDHKPRANARTRSQLT